MSGRAREEGESVRIDVKVQVTTEQPVITFSDVCLLAPRLVRAIQTNRGDGALALRVEGYQVDLDPDLETNARRDPAITLQVNDESGELTPTGIAREIARRITSDETVTTDWTLEYVAPVPATLTDE
jgi:hypothetical protein